MHRQEEQSKAREGKGRESKRKTTTTCDYIKDKQHILYTICVILYKFPKHYIHILYTMYRCIMYTYIYN